ALRSPTAPKWPEAHIKVRAEWLHMCDERAIAESYRGFHEDDIHADLQHLSVLTALMAAGKGGVILPDDEAEIRRLLPSIAFARVEGAGHQIQVDDIEGFLSTLSDLIGLESRRPQDRRC
ncbi:hypothetical protein ABI066_15695, partial [Enterococcus faecium]|uniref:alpha/beta fold hydrolase n=1 Tax=Enterococcus faecium TaxID=1352 RepID=UPI003F424553